MRLKIDRNQAAPLHQQIRCAILSHIRRGSVPPGGKLFTESSLAKDNRISLAPVRQAIDSLVAEGVLERQRAKGVYLLDTAATPRRRITFVVPDISHSFYGSMVRGVESYSREHAYDIVIACSDFQESEELAVLTNLESVDPHLLLICSTGGAENIRQVQRLIDRGFTIVAVDQNYEGWNVSSVTNDNVRIGLDAVNYLLQRGHRRIAFLTEEEETLSNARQRRQGYEQAMRAAGLKPEIVSVCRPHLGETWDLVQPRVVSWLENRDETDRPTGLFVINDTDAIGVLRALEELGISVPEEMSVIGCADLDFARMLTRPLTTVDQDSYGMGVKAAKLGIEQLETGQSAPVHITQPHRIISRTTVRNLLSSKDDVTTYPTNRTRT
ncbi:MAG: substrate-binding domain-containing protein [Phycisphaerae bacterium]|nr:substrate-binding domain-containing protein [Phycisphaerae bacterium]